MARPRTHPDRATIETGLGAALIAVGGLLIAIAVAHSKWTGHGAQVALFVLGVLCTLAGIYVFLQYYVQWLPSLPAPRARRVHLTPPLPSAMFEFMTPQSQINALITEGENILRWIPASPAPRAGSPSQLAALLGQAAGGPRHFKQIAGWEARAAEKVRTLAPSYTSLFTTDQVPNVTYDDLRTYLEARVGELKEILKKL